MEIMWSLPYLLFFLRVSGIQPVTYAASVSASQSIVDAEPRREIDETWDYDYESGDNILSYFYQPQSG